jgi:parallel beta-helix repeat protein
MKRLVQVSMALLVVLLLSPHAVAHARAQGAKIWVNTEDDSETPDDYLSLREAIKLASGERVGCFTENEKWQANANWGGPFPSYPLCSSDLSHIYPTYTVFGPDPWVGTNWADSIVFENNIGTITLGSALPTFWQNDNIDGGNGTYGGRVRLVGSGIGSGNGITVYCGDCDTSNQIVNLVLEGFPGDGVNIVGSWANGVVLQGLDIHDNKGDGIHIDSGRLYNTRNTQIGGASASQRNFIYANGGAIPAAPGSGIVLIGTTSTDTVGNFNNRIENSYIGVSPAGSTLQGNWGHGIYLQDMLGNTISENVVSGNGQDGIKLVGSGSDYNTIRGNTIGLNAAQNARGRNGSNGVTIAGGAQHNIIGGSGVGEGNVIAGNGLHGIGMYDANTNANGVYSNTIGTNPASAGGLGNGGEGVHLENGPSDNVIGTGGAGNLISGNAHDGVQLGGSGTNSNLVYNNTIGLSASRTSTLPNGYSGVAIFGGASSNVIGFSDGLGNVIAGNGFWGIYIADSHTDGNNVYANYIGTSPAGAAGLGNTYDGISMYYGTTHNKIGDSYSSSLRNYIAGNGGVGVAIGDAGTGGNAVLGNAIGTVDFVTPLPNSMGISLTGGTTYNSIIGNYIAGNTTQGVGLYNTGTMSNTVQLNFIGWFFTAMGNGMNGVVIQDSASANTIDQNLIISNGQNGVYLNSAGTMNNVISNNVIGTNSGGGPGFGNTGRGILFGSGATYNTVLSGTIAYNNGGGISAMPGSGQNSFLRLNEFSNAGLGIDLLNPAGVGCTSGAAGGNRCVAPPAIAAAAATLVHGSAAYPSARIDVYVSDGDPSGYGEGRYWLTSVTTDGSGNWTANLGANICATYGTTAKLTATTTSSKGGTSEYARNFPACNKLFLPLVER